MYNWGRSGDPLWVLLNCPLFHRHSFSGFRIPYTHGRRDNINVDSLVLKLPQAVRKTLNVITKCTGIGLFLDHRLESHHFGMDLRKAGEVSPTLRYRFTPSPMELGICCFIECLVLFCDVVKILGGKMSEIHSGDCWSSAMVVIFLTGLELGFPWPSWGSLG